MPTAPTRIDEDVYASAKAAAAVSSRSASQQINHWARIGRALEASGTISTRDVARVLSGEASYDDLGSVAQAVVRAEWDERITAAREGLDLAAEFVAQGETWVEADAQGRPVERAAPKRARAAARPAAPARPRPRRRAS